MEEVKTMPKPVPVKQDKKKNKGMTKAKAKQLLEEYNSSTRTLTHKQFIEKHEISNKAMRGLIDGTTFKEFGV